MKDQLSVYEFGRQLLDTLDLDPVYVLLWESDLRGDELNRWLLAYWCFYHMGTASWIVDAGPRRYWERMATAAASKEYPRSSERRHFRGKAATTSVAWLEEQGLDNLFHPLIGCDTTLESVMKYVTTWKLFGPWIAFKVADMVDRLDLGKIEFSTASVFLFDSPRKGAEEAWDRYGEGEKPANLGEWATKSIREALAAPHAADLPPRVYLAPPRNERLINGQEVETILCKWKSYLGGHYHIGEDTIACRKSLLRFAKTKTAQRLLKAGNGGLWDASCRK